MKRLITISTLAVMFFSSGCVIPALLGTETRQERKVNAEYNLYKQAKNKKILVYVEQPAWLVSEANLRQSLTGAINKFLDKKAGVSPKKLIEYNTFIEFEEKHKEFPGGYGELASVSIAKAMKADLVLHIAIQEHHFSKIANSALSKGFLAGRCAIFDSHTSKMLWPASRDGRLVRVGFDIDENGFDAGIKRLTTAFAHCTTRYFYNCEYNKFKIFDDRSVEELEKLND